MDQTQNLPVKTDTISRPFSDGAPLPYDAPFSHGAAMRAGLALFLLLAGIYLLVYRGHPLSIDEVGMFDSVESFVNHGTLDRTIELYRPDEPIVNFPYKQPLYEPMQVVLSSPILWVTQSLPHIGIFHSILFFNAGVTLLTALSLYVIGLRLHYPITVAWLAAFLFAVATLSLHYSRFFFREPLMGFFALWAFYLALELGRQLTIWKILLFLGALLGMILTKQVGVLFLPGILLCLLTQRVSWRQAGLLALAAVSVVAVFLLILFILNPNFGDDRYSITRWINPTNWGLSYMWESFLGYQVSPARSFWLYSPVLLMGVAGAAMLMRRRNRWWFVAGVVITFIGTSAAYGALRAGTNWNGGWSWGPRYMIPLIPVWMLLVMPALAYVVNTRRNTGFQFRLMRFGFVGLVLWSCFVQLLSIAVPFPNFYYDYIQRNPNEPVLQAWSGANWSWENSPFSYHLSQLNLLNLDIAWPYASRGLWVITAALLIIGLGLYVLYDTRLNKWRLYGAAALSILLLVGSIGAGLYMLRHDPRYVKDRADMQNLIFQLNRQVSPDDLLLINGSDFTVMLMFMNWFKAGSFYVTLPDSPQTDSNVAAPDTTFTAANPLDSHLNLLDDLTVEAVQWARNTYRKVWLVTQTGVFTPNMPRTLETVMGQMFYPGPFLETSPIARGLLYYNVNDGSTAQQVDVPEVQADNNIIQLESAVMPEGVTFTAGDAVPVSLVWTLPQPVDIDYQVSVQIIDEIGMVVVQQDSFPQGNVGQTSLWQAGESHKDQHVLILPSNVDRGLYYVYVRVYQWINGDSFDMIFSHELTQITVE